MQPSTLIPGAPRVLVAEAPGNLALSELANRIAEGLRRQGVPAVGPIAWHATSLDGARTANCLLLLGGPAPLLLAGAVGDPPRLLALFPATADLNRASLLKLGSPIAAAVVAKPDMSEKQAALFFVELFSELHTHCRNGISTGMLRFCLAKAARLAPNQADLWI